MASCSGTRGTLLVTRDAPRDAGAELDGRADDGLWEPPSDASFQVQLTGELDTSLDVDVYFLDVDYPPEGFATLHAAGRRTVCHFSAGSVETFRDDAEALPERVRGNPLANFPEERWLDVRASEVREVMRARLARAKMRGCSAVLPTNLSVQVEDTGWDLTLDDAVAYARWLAGEAEALGLSSALSSDELIEPLAGDYHMGLAYQCLATDGCARWAPMREAGKTVLAVQVDARDEAETVCARARNEGLSAIIKDSDFDAFRIGCP